VNALAQFGWVVGFCALSAAMLLAPFVPAMREWLRPTDTEPLQVTREFDGDIRYFAQFFDRLWRDAAGAALSEAQAMRSNDQIATLGRDPFRLLGDPAAWAAQHAAAPGPDDEGPSAYGGAPGGRPGGNPGRVHEGLIAAGDLALPERAAFERGVVSCGTLRIGADTVVRSAQAAQDLELAPGAAVLRWADCGRDMTLGDRASVLGRATASREIRLGIGVEFQRMRAARIVVGTAPEPAAPHGLTEIAVKGTALDGEARYMRVDGDLNIAPRSRVSVNLIVAGNLTVGALAAVDGSIKAYGRVSIGRGAHVNGAIATVQSLRLEPGASAVGPLISEQVIELAYGTRVGTPQDQSTVTADRILLEDGAVVCGTVWARSAGETHPIAAQ
jgi:cytoskeletal protein CcmA (bactofilin family)